MSRLQNKGAARRRAPSAAVGEPRGVTHAVMVRRAIEAEILIGKLAPNTAIDEAALAARFKVSRTPVREAVMKLVEAGLIERRSRKRSEVVGLDLKRLILSFETLADLEALSARYCARRGTAAEKAALKKNHVQAASVLKAGDIDRYVILGVRFHELIAEAAHNEVLRDLAARVRVRLVPYRRLQTMGFGRLEANQRAHDEILEAILKNDGDAAYALMQHHGAIQSDILADFLADPTDLQHLGGGGGGGV